MSKEFYKVAPAVAAIECRKRLPLCRRRRCMRLAAAFVEEVFSLSQSGSKE